MNIQTITRKKLVPKVETIYVTPDGREFTSRYDAECHVKNCRKAAVMEDVLLRLFGGRAAAVAAALKDMHFWHRRDEVLAELDRRINAKADAA